MYNLSHSLSLAFPCAFLPGSGWLLLQDECATEVLAREEIRPAPKQLVRRVLSSLLHALSVRQSDVCLVRLFEGAIDFLRRYGARVFVSAVGDRMQVTSRKRIRTKKNFHPSRALLPVQRGVA